MTRTERLRRLRDLEVRLGVARAPRAYVRFADTGEWLGGGASGQPGLALTPGDLILTASSSNPASNSRHGSPARELTRPGDAESPVRPATRAAKLP